MVCNKQKKIFPKLLLQTINIRALGLAHAEIIQKLMSTSSVNPLVQEVTAKPEVMRPSATTDRTRDFASFPSTPCDSEAMDYDKNPSIDTESNHGSDDEDSIHARPRGSMESERDYETEDFSQSSPRNIWRKRRKLSMIPQEEPVKFEPVTFPKPIQHIKQEFTRSNSVDFKPYSNSPLTPKRPHDHQVPSFIPTAYQDDMNIPNRSSSLRHLPPKKQSMSKSNHMNEQIYRPQSTSANDLSYDHPSARLHSFPQTPLPIPHGYHEGFRQEFLNYHQQQQNEQNLLLLSLANNQQTTVDPIQSQLAKPLKSDEQELLNAIHAHPNKRDLVLNLLRQMNEASSPPIPFPENPNYLNQQRRSHPELPANYSYYRSDSNADDNNDSY